MDEGFASSATVRVPAGFSVDVELEDKEGEERGHHDDSGEGGVVVCEEVGETGVGEGVEGGRKEVDKGGGDEDACAKVLGDEEGFGRDGEPFDFFGDDGEAAADD